MYRSISILIVLGLALAGVACSNDNGPTEPNRRYIVRYSATSDQPITFLEFDPGNAIMESRRPNTARWEVDLQMTDGDTAMLSASSFNAGATVVVNVIAVSSDGAGNDFDLTDTCMDLCTATVGPIELE